MTNAAFAARLGVAERTVASWHSKPSIVPRAEIQAALDTMHGGADASVRLRFREGIRPTAGAAAAQALRVAIAVVTRGEDVLLVCRRDGGAISWQFPAGMVKPGASPEAVAARETHAETGVHCTVRKHLGGRVHPVTGVTASYFLCDYLLGEATNLDPLENADVQWIPRTAIPKFIPEQSIYPPILEALA